MSFCSVRIAYLARSSYLPSRPGKARVIEVHGMPGGADGFSAAADFSYLIKPTYTLENVAKIREAAEYLGMAEVQDSTKKFLYMNIFNHWRSSIAFLQQYKRLHAPVDDYIESRCLKVISAACIKAFFDTKYLSAPISLASSASGPTLSTWQSSPCQVLTDTLVRVASLPDSSGRACQWRSQSCRQGRNVKGWLEITIMAECWMDRSRCWVVICLIRMLEKSVTLDRPWLELSSQYWCSLLEHAVLLMKRVEVAMVEQLQLVLAFLEERIGGSLHELDDYLLSYNFEPQTLLAMVQHFKQAEDIGDKERKEVVGEVDSRLWSFVETASVSAEDFVSFIEAFPETSRMSHDMLYAALEKLIGRREVSSNKKQRLWGLVDIAKLSGPYRETAINNAMFVCQPHVLEYVLKQHIKELSVIGDVENLDKLSQIMEKVIQASLKLLEENSRRSKEITELQMQYAALLGVSKAGFLQGRCDGSPDILFGKSRMNEGCIHAIAPDEVEAHSDTPAR